jgi:hypothetical protein
MELILRNLTATINPWVKQVCRGGHELPLGEPTIGEYKWCIKCWEDMNGPISDKDKAIIRANVITETIKMNDQENREMSDELFHLAEDYDLRSVWKAPQDYEITMVETTETTIEQSRK